MDDALYADFDAWVGRFAEFVRAKGKVLPGKHRAYGHEPPRHFWADIRLFWRDMRMRLGFPRQNSSSQIQQKGGLNRDVTISPKKGEGEKLRK